MRLEAQAKAGFYPTPPDVVNIIRTWVGEKMAGPRRLLDPCCGTGEPAAQIAAAAGCDAYGIEINTERALTAKKLLSKVVATDLFSVRARLGAFSILYLNPPYDFDAEDGRQSFPSSSIPPLSRSRRPSLFVVPQKRITPRIARVLSAYFEDLKVRKFPADEFQSFGQIVITGLKKARAEVNGDVLASLTEIQSMDLPEMHRNEFSFPVPAVGRDFFIRSSEFGPDELPKNLRQVPLERAGARLIEEEEQIRPAIQPLMPPESSSGNAYRSGTDNNQILEANGKSFLSKDFEEGHRSIRRGNRKRNKDHGAGKNCHPDKRL
jgi:hypothetical protein